MCIRDRPLTSWTLEDGDGTEVNVSNGKEVKFVEGGGIDIDWTDVDNGTDGDPYDLTFTVNAAQTGITSLLATDIKIGEDDETKVDFETADEIHLYAANANKVTVDTNGLTLNTGALSLKNGATSAGKIEFYEDSDNGTNKVTLIGPASTADITLTLPSSDGDSGQALTTDGNGVMSWTTIGGAYNSWNVITSGSSHTATSKDQLVILSASAFTVTLPSSPSVGDTVVIHNAGAGTVTVGRNSVKIESADSDGTLFTDDSTHLVYVSTAIGWKEINV